MQRKSEFSVFGAGECVCVSVLPQRKPSPTISVQSVQRTFYPHLHNILVIDSVNVDACYDHVHDSHFELIDFYKWIEAAITFMLMCSFNNTTNMTSCPATNTPFPLTLNTIYFCYGVVGMGANQ